jgi:hypothetical protein
VATTSVRGAAASSTLLVTAPTAVGDYASRFAQPDTKRAAATTETCGCEGGDVVRSHWQSLLLVIVILLEILEKAGPGRLPSEQFPGDFGGGGAVQTNEVAQVGKVFASVGGGY